MLGTQKVLITADQHKTEEYADMNTIVTLVALQGLNPSIYSIVELLTKSIFKMRKIWG